MSEDSVSGEPTAPPRFIVTLVHGTWARRAKWTREGSPLREAVAEALGPGVHFEPHIWRGRNRNRERKEAASLLAATLKGQADRNPGAIRFVVAHSHGGNVAMYALGSVAAEAAPAGVVCFNTPFIAAFRRNTEQVFWVAFFLFAVLIPFLGLTAVTAPFQVETDWGDPLGSLISQLVNPGVMVLLVGVVVWMGIFVIVLAAGAGVRSWLLSRRERTIADVSLPNVADVPLLSVWAAGDEIQGVFRLLDGLSSVPYLVLHIYSLVTAFILAVALHLTGVIDRLAIIERLRADNVAESAEEAWLDIASSAVYVVIFFVVLVIAAIALSLLLEATPAGLPTLSFIDSLFARVSFAVVPVSVRHSELWDIPLPFTLLAHSAAYKNPLVLASVGNWMRSISGTRTDRHPDSQPPTATPPTPQPDPDETPRW